MNPLNPQGLKPYVNLALVKAFFLKYLTISILLLMKMLRMPTDKGAARRLLPQIRPRLRRRRGEVQGLGAESPRMYALVRVQTLKRGVGMIHNEQTPTL